MSFVAINPLGVNCKVKFSSFSFQIAQVANAKETLNLLQIEKAIAADCEANELVIVGEIAVATLVSRADDLAWAEVVDCDFCHVLILACFGQKVKGVTRTLKVGETVP